ncbi:hypothetical protein SR914_15190 [Comamonas testosteroni]|jgi:hypothetical protein|uniref:N-linked glycosylation glycosyltransferase PglG n=2 Tax=Comamonas testosteroni TaxID=285 RepID=B7X0H1_COMTK|nr:MULTISPECIES: hypothetical protein [Comamonas]AIJ48105.1 hypothetical protein O987_20055 [Comamonas testosteroni TK102]EED66321.1 conserved hypothetical protein [Comamonas testosteroni KF-1]MPS90980.1 hypothetical protein [Comamonas sp.]TYK68296.1 hypothetical protein FSY59_22080 [Comamonas sp. Z3]WQG64573.1 hypothetical protein SR914_15190 [Comamonas testosteroni]
MKLVHLIYAVTHSLIALLFGFAALSLVWIAVTKAWGVIVGGLQPESTLHAVEALGILASGVVALQISQTMVEEEVVREAHISGPTRVRRFLSRFMVVLVVALAIEGLVATFKAQETPEQLLYPAALLVSVGVLLAGWGVFVHLNRSAEELEPEAMQQAKSEDHKVSDEH